MITVYVGWNTEDYKNNHYSFAIYKNEILQNVVSFHENLIANISLLKKYLMRKVLPFKTNEDSFEVIFTTTEPAKSIFNFPTS